MSDHQLGLAGCCPKNRIKCDIAYARDMVSFLISMKFSRNVFPVYQRVMRTGQLPPPSEVCQDTVDFIFSKFQKYALEELLRKISVEVKFLISTFLVRFRFLFLNYAA